MFVSLLMAIGPWEPIGSGVGVRFVSVAPSITVSDDSPPLFTKTRLVSGFTTMNCGRLPTGIVVDVLFVWSRTVTELAASFATYTLLVTGFTATNCRWEGGKLWAEAVVKKEANRVKRRAIRRMTVDSGRGVR